MKPVGIDPEDFAFRGASSFASIEARLRRAPYDEQDWALSDNSSRVSEGQLDDREAWGMTRKIAGARRRARLSRK